MSVWNNRQGDDKQSGQGLVEYALILSLVAMASIIVLSVLGNAISDIFETVSCELAREENCTAGGVCGNEEVGSSAVLCFDSGTRLTGFFSSDCSGTRVNLQNYGELARVDGYTINGLQVYSTDFGSGYDLSPCSGVPNGNYANGTFTFTSLHPDGGYTTVTYTYP